MNNSYCLGKLLPATAWLRQVTGVVRSAEVGSGANVVLFTTSLGTPTGNPVAPVVKIGSNTKLARRMPDIIDGEETSGQTGEQILEYVIRVAGGEEVAAVRHDQTGFIPWKRGVSL